MMTLRIKRTLVAIFVFFAIPFLVQSPSNDRDWQIGYDKLSSVTKSGDTYTINSLRDFSYTESSFFENYTSKEIQPEKLSSMYFLIEPFGGYEGIAHTLFIFEFDDSSTIAFSIEARKEENETFSALRGLFNQYELLYQWGTKKDFIDRRTIYLNHDVYIYPLTISRETAAKILIQLLEDTMQIEKSPRFYNTIFDNCTNNLAKSVNKVSQDSLPLHYARILTGYSDEYLYSQGYIDNSISFDEAQKKALYKK